MNKHLSFNKALIGACKAVHPNIINLDYYVIPIIRTLDDLCLEKVRHTESGDLDSKVVSDHDLSMMTDFGEDVWRSLSD